MKKVIASAGVLAAGTAALQAQYLPAGQAGRFWTASLAVRAFYDDNYFTYPSQGVPAGTDTIKPLDSFGIEVSPSIRYNLVRDQNTIQGAYTYSMKYYQDRGDEPIDGSHDLSVLIDHRFSERYRGKLSEQFVYSQEPDVNVGTATTSPIRRGDNSYAHNLANLDFSGVVTRTFGVRGTYQNSFYDYKDDKDFYDPDAPGPSLSGLLDRIEQNFDLAAQWLKDERTKFSLGYGLNLANYTSDDVISDGPLPNAVPPPPGSDVARGTDRSSIAQRGYLGFEKTLANRIEVRGRAGAEFTSYDFEFSENSQNPYVEISGSYEYQRGSKLTLGVLHHRSATDVAGTSGTNITQDAVATLGYIDLSHKITAKTTARVLWQVQNSLFSGGDADGESDNFYTLALSLDYRINEHWAAELGYTWDRLDSFTATRSYSRNRVFIGTRLTY